MKIVQVREGKFIVGSYVNLNVVLDDELRKSAFRYHFGRKEQDFNELIHSTIIWDVSSIDQSTTNLVLRMT